MDTLSNRTSKFYKLSNQELEMLDKVGLIGSTIQNHLANVSRFLENSIKENFEIVDTCRLENSGVHPCFDQSPDTDFFDVVSFIPAAGASSRWLAPLAALSQAAQNADFQAIESTLEDLISKNLLNCPIPATLRTLLTYWQTSRALPTDFDINNLILDIDAPKALFPVVTEGDTFLQLKIFEDDSLATLGGRIFVCPITYRSKFYDAVEQCVSDKRLKTIIYEQDESLSTTRFDKNCKIALKEDGLPSIVPAGHGSLLNLLPKVKNDFPQARSVWIRNIDNVVGTSRSAVQKSKDFLFTHKLILGHVEDIRHQLSINELLKAQDIAGNLYRKFFGAHNEGNRPNYLQLVLERLFHTSSSSALEIEDYRALYSRMVVTMGQVPNTNRDIGGSPVFAIVNGATQKLCIEVPHVSKLDQVKFLESAEKATHFNPVFVAAEIPSTGDLERWNNHPFWLIATKHWRGQDVHYQESILYEMIGSSAYVNLTFVEVPRLLFNPHKSLSDLSGKRRRDWT